MQAVRVVFEEFYKKMSANDDLIHQYELYFSNLFSVLEASHVFSTEIHQMFSDYFISLKDKGDQVIDDERVISRRLILKQVFGVDDLLRELQSQVSRVFQQEESLLPTVKNIVSKIKKQLSLILKNTEKNISILKELFLLGKIDSRLLLIDIIDSKFIISKYEAIKQELLSSLNYLNELKMIIETSVPKKAIVLIPERNDQEGHNRIADFKQRLKYILDDISLLTGKVNEVFKELSHLHLQTEEKTLASCRSMINISSSDIKFGIKQAEEQKRKKKMSIKINEQIIKKMIEGVVKVLKREGQKNRKKNKVEPKLTLVGFYRSLQKLKKIVKNLYPQLKKNNIEKAVDLVGLSKILEGYSEPYLEAYIDYFDNTQLTEGKIYHYMGEIKTIVDKVVGNLSEHLNWIDPQNIYKLRDSHSNDSHVGVSTAKIKENLEFKLFFVMLLHKVFKVPTTFQFELIISDAKKNPYETDSHWEGEDPQQVSIADVSTRLSNLIARNIKIEFERCQVEGKKTNLENLDRDLISISELVKMTPQVKKCLYIFMKCNKSSFSGFQKEELVDELTADPHQQLIIKLLFQVFEISKKVEKERGIRGKILKNVVYKGIVKLLSVYLSASLSTYFGQLINADLTPAYVGKLVGKTINFLRDYASNYQMNQYERDFVSGLKYIARSDDIFQTLYDKIPRFKDLSESDERFKDRFEEHLIQKERMVREYFLRQFVAKKSETQGFDPKIGTSDLTFYPNSEDFSYNKTLIIEIRKALCENMYDFYVREWENHFSKEKKMIG